MSTEEEEQEELDEEDPKKALIEGIKQILLEIRSIKVDDLVLGTNLGPFNFKKYEDQFREVIEFASELQELPHEYLTEAEATAWLTVAKSLSDGFEAVQEFDPEDGETPGTTRDQLATTIINQFESLKGTAKPHLGYLLLKREPQDKKNFRSEVARAKRNSEELKKEGEELKKQSEGLRDELQGIVNASRSAAGQVGVDIHAGDFSAIAIDHETQAKNWLIATMGGIAAAILIPLIFLYFFPLDPNDPLIINIQKGVIKVAILFILYFLISQSVKNYRTHRHLFVVNKHRETSLKTFQTFVQAAGDEQTKTQILLEAARTIFAPTNTGYVVSEDENPHNRVVEILKMVKDTKP